MSKKTILITGGLGYIGSHTIVELFNKEFLSSYNITDEFEVVIIDNCSNCKEKVLEVIERITGDPIIEDLIEPHWLTKKFVLLNDIDKEMLGYNIFERITKEGRKYAVLLGLISQRPSELSTTALSQCSNFLMFKLLHPLNNSDISFALFVFCLLIELTIAVFVNLRIIQFFRQNVDVKNAFKKVQNLKKIHENELNRVKKLAPLLQIVSTFSTLR